MPRVFSGIQPSGELHIGNYLGAVRNWIDLQDKHECLISIVDYHSITQDFDPSELTTKTMDMAISLLAAGIDPEKCTLFVQSHVPEHTELSWILTTVTPLGELERMTQFKDKSRRQESIPAGLLNYPILQAADILLYRADLVPVGEDQVQHLELVREIARKWNARYKADFFPEPKAMVGTAKRIVGLDGEAKMSKSLGNTIGIVDEPERIWEQLKPAKTDPARVTRNDPGDPEKCNLYTLHHYFSNEATVNNVADQCRNAGWGCLDCKKVLAQGISSHLEPVRERGAELRADPGRVAEILRDGAKAAGRLARETMSEVREHMGVMRAARSQGSHT
ncbi:MAG: tryptophan--tRNA ligase [Gemmatimonadetes bacterium]|nr:tryptophan--tRNA ligase [Gemmatimonadota bacterium]